VNYERNKKGARFFETQCIGTVSAQCRSLLWSSDTTVILIYLIIY